mmetsp:Transcript_122022/g.249103  ORF Transcript_122022/g.249103 Transcript_122022/m.249103 type:complete len:264 (-) Transcript_122022:569-1360(-)
MDTSSRTHARSMHFHSILANTTGLLLDLDGKCGIFHRRCGRRGSSRLVGGWIGYGNGRSSRGGGCRYSGLGSSLVGSRRGCCWSRRCMNRVASRPQWCRRGCCGSSVVSTLRSGKGHVQIGILCVGLRQNLLLVQGRCVPVQEGHGKGTVVGPGDCRCSRCRLAPVILTRGRFGVGVATGDSVVSGSAGLAHFHVGRVLLSLDDVVVALSHHHRQTPAAGSFFVVLPEVPGQGFQINTIEFLGVFLDSLACRSVPGPGRHFFG